MDKIVFLEPVFCERIWGGRNLESFNFDIPEGNIGEAWVVAAHDNGSSKIVNGELAGLTLKEAYHMNKSNWVTLLLDGSLPEEEIIRLLELSHDLTKPAARRTRPPAAD